MCIRDRDGDLAVRRLEDLEDVAMVAVPLLLLPARAVNLVLEMHGTSRSEQKGSVEQLAVTDVRVRAADQVVAVAHRMPAEQFLSLIHI